MKKAILFAAGAMLLLSIPSRTFGQANFDVGSSYAGPTIGLAFLGSAPQFGLNYEYAMKMDFGMVGIGGVLRYWSYSEGFYYGNWKYSNFLIGAQGNYHFKVDRSTKFDPWAGLVLGYDASSVSWDGPGGYNYSSPTSGGLVLNLQGGTRYWVSPTVALRASLGYGTLSYGALDVGVDFKF